MVALCACRLPMRQMSHNSSFRPANLLMVGHSTFCCYLLYQGHSRELLGSSSTLSVDHQTTPFPTLRLALFSLARKLSRGGMRTEPVPGSVLKYKKSKCGGLRQSRAPQVALHFARFGVHTATTVGVIYY